MSDLKLSLVLQLKNLLKGGLADTRREIKELSKDAKDLSSIKGPNAQSLNAYREAARKAALQVRALKRELAQNNAKDQSVLANDSKFAVGMGLAGYLKAGAVGYGAKKALDAAVDFEKAMANVRKKVNAPDESGFVQLEGQINKIAKEYGIARVEVAGLVAEAGAAGIAFDDLERFTRLAAKAAVSWDMSAPEASQKLAEIKAGTNMTIGELELLGDMINALGDNSAAKERDIVEMFGRSAAAAKAAGVDFKTTLAVLTGVRATGMDPEVAARWFNDFSGTLRTLEEPNKKQIEGLKLLGLTGKKVADGMKKDALGTMLDIFKRLEESPDKASAALNIFGKGWWDETARAGQALPEIIKQMEMLKSGSYKGSMNKTLNIDLATTANHLERFKSLVGEIGDRMGRWALPGINAAIDTLIQKLDGLDKQSPSRKVGKDLLQSSNDKLQLMQKAELEATTLHIQAGHAKNKPDRVRLTLEARKKEQEAKDLQKEATVDRFSADQAFGTASKEEANTKIAPLKDKIGKAQNLLDRQKNSFWYKKFGIGNLSVKALEAELPALQNELKALETQAQSTGNEIKSNLFLDLSMQGMQSATSWAQGFKAGIPAMMQAIEAVQGVKFPLLTPPATFSQPAPAAPQKQGANSAPTTIKLGAINIHGASDPEATAKLVERRLASAINQGLWNAHHDGVA